LDNLLSQSELPRDATASENHVLADEGGASPQSPPVLSPELEAQESPSLRPPEIPVASLQPPLALLLPDATDHELLESRIRRLEAELDRMRNSAAAETRVAHQFSSASADASGGFLGRLLAPSSPAKPHHGTPNLSSMVPSGVRHSWLLFDALAELRAMYWMFFDPRYHLSWTARLVPLVFAILIMTSYYWTPGTSLPFFIGTAIEKLCDLILAYFLYKLLAHESRRYRETAPDLPPSLRL
jgi:hypothetical protein